MIQSIDRAARILSSLQGARHLGITELAAILELPPSTVHGLVKSLQEHGLVAKEPGTSRYMLGPALLKLSNVYLDTLDVRARAMRWTAELARRTGCATRLGVPLFDEVIVIHHNRRPDGSEQMPEIGVTIPAHASALGKVLLAYDPNVADPILAGDAAQPHRRDAHRPCRPRRAARADRRARDRPRRGRGGARRVVDRRADRRPLGSGDRGDRRRASRRASTRPGDTVLNDLREAARNVSRELGAQTWPPAVTPRRDRRMTPR